MGAPIGGDGGASTGRPVSEDSSSCEAARNGSPIGRPAPGGSSPDPPGQASTSCGGIAPQEERFDIYDEAGQWLGTASRSEVHARGYWHRSFHCWLARREGGRKLVMFQLRNADKDTFPDYFDITAAGHLTAGESVRDAVREVEEELGVAVAFDALIPLGETRKESSGTAKGAAFIDREISDVFGYVYDGPPSSLRLQADEVAGVYEAELETMIALFEGQLGEVTARGIESAPDGQVFASERTVRAEDFVTRPASYYAGIFRALLRHV